jgi:hypothetical protein
VDFSDLALAVSTEASLIGGGEYRGKVIEAVKKALLGNDLDNHRKAILLRTFGFEVALRETAEHLFVNERDIEVQGAAFQLLRRTIAPSYVVRLARPILSAKIARDNEEHKGLVIQAAKTVATYDVGDAALAVWLKSRSVDDTETLIDDALVGLSALHPIGDVEVSPSKKMSDAEKNARFSFAVQRLQRAIEAGAEIGWTDTAARQPIVAVHIHKPGDVARYVYIDEPQTLLTKSLGGRLLSALGRDSNGLRQLVRAMTAGADDRPSFGRPFRVEVRLGLEDSLTTTTGDIITMARIGNPIYLERTPDGNAGVLMRWRDIDGVFKIAYLKDASIKEGEVEIIPASPAMDAYLSGYSYNNLPIM